MTINKFENYKTISDKILDLLIAEKSSSLKDIKIIYNIIMGFPYCLDQEGHYVYGGKYYNSIRDLPKDAVLQLPYRKIDKILLGVCE